MAFIPKSGGGLSRKYFMFSAKKGVDVIGGFQKQEPEQAPGGTILNGATQSYSWTENFVSGKVRIRVYAYTSSSASMGALLDIKIDGNAVVSGASTTVPSGSYGLIYDYIGDISAGSHTIEIDITNNTSSVYYTPNVYIVIINGWGTESTSEETLGTITPSSYYTLLVSEKSNFGYSLGVRVKVVGNRKTTSNFTLKLGGTELQNYDNSATDDGDNIVAIGYGTCDYADSIDLTGYVGASGDAIIITNLYVYVTLRDNQSDAKGVGTWPFVINEKGIAYISVSAISLDGNNYTLHISQIREDDYADLEVSQSGTDVASYVTIPANNVVIWGDKTDDNSSLQAIISLSVEVIQ